jgi:hypothetical protein
MRVSVNGLISTVAGTGTRGYSGDGGPATLAELFSPSDVALDDTGNLYISDGTSRIRRVAPDGTISTVAGIGTQGYSGDGGPAVNAALFNPGGIVLDSVGNLYIADFGNSRVRKVAPNGTITTVVGTGQLGYSKDGGPATAAQIGYPTALALDRNGNLYVADLQFNVVRKITTTGMITTVPGGSRYVGVGGLAVDQSGNLFTAEPPVVYRVAPDGSVSIVAGIKSQQGNLGDGGPATSAQFFYPAGLSLGPGSSIFVSDVGNESIRQLVPVGTSPLLQISKSHQDNFWPGEGAAGYTFEVSNATGAGATNGTVTVTEFPPGQIDSLFMVGSGWTCSAYTCTRSDALEAGTAFPPITVTTSVASAASMQIMNSAVVSNGTSEAAGSDFTGILGVPTSPVLTSPALGSSSVSITTLLTWKFAEGATSFDVYFGNNPTPPFATTTTNVTFAPGTLVPGTTYYWSVTAKNVYASSASVVGSFTTAASDALPQLTVTSNHSGSFVQGQPGASYSVAVGNASGTNPTRGLVTLTETVPAGLTLVSMAGVGWVCPGTAANNCVRTDAVQGGASYPPIIVTVEVSASAATQVTNAVSATGGGSALASATDPTSISVFTCDLNQDGSADVADVQIIINEALGARAAADDLNHDGVVNVADVQKLINAVLGLGCRF